MSDPAAAAARDEAERLGTIVGSDVDRVEHAIAGDLAGERSVDLAALKAEVARLEAAERDPNESMLRLVHDWARLAEHIPALIAQVESVKAVLRAKSGVIDQLETEVERLRAALEGPPSPGAACEGPCCR